MTPIFDSAHIKAQLLLNIKKSIKSLDLAVAWFTDRDLFMALLDAAARGVELRVLLQEDDINRNNGIMWDQLIAAGGRLYWYASNGGIMHHKFCVMDAETCCFGSYNWTWSASNKNQESILILKDASMAAHFTQALQQMLADPCCIPHLGVATYIAEQGIVQHPGIEKMRTEIALLELEIADLEEQAMALEQKLQHYDVLLQTELAELLLEHLNLNQLLAEAKAKLTRKKEYEKEAERWKEKYEETARHIQTARDIQQPELNTDTREEMARMYKEALFNIHPDRFVNDPLKWEEASNLAKALIEAYKSGDSLRVKEIWQSVQDGSAFRSDLLQSNDLSLLSRYLNKLRLNRDSLLQRIEGFRQHETLKAAEKYPDFAEYIELCRTQLQQNIKVLQTELNTHRHV